MFRLFLFPYPSSAECSGSGLDGDTIEVQHNLHSERIRLSSIDRPELGQAYGYDAKHAASKLGFGKYVMLQTHGLDMYGRTLADGRLPDGTHVNHTMVKEGWRWSIYREADRPVTEERFHT